ncbi:uncharacterized protein BXZ73DRAFT_89860 [Epithele typhae]|uniref:uncharacterized protein n=1 Tax=Epithele typhae TaxID=378194 RepID=UPI002007A7C2|nr:uncharacterized protein BXZ73DRAFT_89860 [Epithele typhae]KAH9933247.1 hypothetical protein BXZ73DRAFT_89860 [Epithele typhae]
MKLTVPRLKALCKDKKLNGYSKLGKKALVQLLEHTPRPVRPYPTPSRRLPLPRPGIRINLKKVTPSTCYEMMPPPPPPKRPRIHPPPVAQDPRRSSGHHSGSSEEGLEKITVRKFPVTRITPQPCQHPPATLSFSLLRTAPSSAHTAPISASSTTEKPVSRPAKRFKPLLTNKSAAVSKSNVPLANTNSSLQRNTESTFSPLEHPVTAVPPLSNINFPPSMSQRRRVQRWAVILSGLGPQERAACSLVSRALRYAVYVSASVVLVHRHLGRRLQDDVLSKYAVSTTDMWPYLRMRDAEGAMRQRIYEASFLARFLCGSGFPNPISPRLWASPDHPKQAAVAMRCVCSVALFPCSNGLTIHRFVLTRAWFELSLGSPSSADNALHSWLRGTVTDAQEVVPGEIWAISIFYPDAQIVVNSNQHETLYVLEPTCEVIRHPAASQALTSALRDHTTRKRPRSPGPTFPVRTDWSAYMTNQKEASDRDRSLLAHLRWPCVEDYDRGISRLWLSRLAANADAREAAALRPVAERYVLACVAANSVSGPEMTASEMAHEFAGLPERVSRRGRPGNGRAAPTLFLPEHHHVESVHFSTPGGREGLHPALAVVQTPHRAYYVLRDNGMQVGCEEDGLAEVWQEVIGCDPRGVTLVELTQ